MGRRKVEMKKIADKNSRFVTFSKRRSGLFNKAAEISTMCATDVAIVVFSPSGKPFSFGQPSVNEVTDRFLELDDGNDADETRGGSVEEIAELSEHLESLNVQLHREKEKEKRLKREMEAEVTDIEDLRLGELRQLKVRLENVREATLEGIGEIENEASNTLLLLSNSTQNS